jgi:integrase
VEKTLAKTTGIRKRGDSYEAWAWDRREKKKVRKTFASFDAAKTWRHDAASGLRKGTVRAPTATTIRAAWDGWLEAAKRGEILSRNREPYKPSSLRGYEHDMAEYVLDDFGALRLAELRPDDVQALIERLLGEELSGSKVRNVLVPLQSLYRRHRREVPVDPTDGLDLPPPGGRRERVASPSEAAELLETLPEEQQALWAVAFYAGLRRGELRALRASAIDWPTATTIRVERSWDDVEGDIGPKSRKGKRVVPVAGVLRTYLLAHKLATGRDGDDFLFGRTAREPFTPTTVRKAALKAWAATYMCGCAIATDEDEKPLDKCPEHKAGHRVPIGLHECRHTYVSLMHAAGNSLEEIGDYVGHSSAYMTDHYRHLIEGQRDQAAAKLDKFLSDAVAR